MMNNTTIEERERLNNIVLTKVVGDTTPLYKLNGWCRIDKNIAYSTAVNLFNLTTDPHYAGTFTAFFYYSGNVAHRPVMINFVLRPIIDTQSSGEPYNADARGTLSFSYDADQYSHAEIQSICRYMDRKILEGDNNVHH